RPEKIGRPKPEAQLSEVRLAHPCDRLGRWKGAPRRTLDRIAPGARQALDAGRDLPDIRGGGADERGEGFPWFLAKEPEPQEREKTRNRSQLLGMLEVNPGVFVEPQIVPERILAWSLAQDLDGEGAGSVRPRQHLRALDDAAPAAVHTLPAEGLTARERQVEIERSDHPKRVARTVHTEKIYTIRVTAARFPLTLRENAWDDRETPYESTLNRPRTADRGNPRGRVPVPGHSRARAPGVAGPCGCRSRVRDRERRRAYGAPPLRYPRLDARAPGARPRSACPARSRQRARLPEGRRVRSASPDRSNSGKPRFPPVLLLRREALPLLDLRRRPDQGHSDRGGRGQHAVQFVPP